MKNGIAIIGLNGSGKSTLAYALSKKINYYGIDVEDYYFPEQKISRKNALENNYSVDCNFLGLLPYSLPRSKSEVAQSILEDIMNHPQFIISGVTMNWGEKILSTIKIAFWIKTPIKERVKRVREREEKRWGSRVLKGGDMYNQQCSFIKFIRSLSENKVAESIKKLNCDTFILDGTMPVQDNIDFMIDKIEKI